MHVVYPGNADLRHRLARPGTSFSIAALFAACLSLGMMVTAPNALAQDPTTAARSSDDAASASTGYVNPFPEGDTYKVQVYGDSYAEGLLEGLTEGFNNEPRVAVAKKHRSIGILIRSDYEDDIKPEEVSRDVVHIGVLMIGLNDRDRIRMPGGGKSLQLGNEDWIVEYGRRVDRWIKVLKKRGIALYVVGQPPLRRPEANKDAETITEVMREKAYLNGVRFIDLSEGFTDEGSFTQFGPDISGNRVKLREADGVTFTGVGNRKLAHYVEREMRRDITQAKIERTIPLAGSEAEQRKINPGKISSQAPGQFSGQAGGQLNGQSVGPSQGPGSPPQAKGQVARDARLALAKSGATPGATPSSATAVGDSANDQRADNSKLSLRLPGPLGKEETVLIDIVRPAIPSAVIALVTRKEVADRATQLADTPAEEIAGGVTIVNSVSLGTDAAGSPARRRAAAGQSATFSVLVKGERPPPKPGRADDFAWPKPAFAQPVAPTPVSAQPTDVPKTQPQSQPKSQSQPQSGSNSKSQPRG
jgi:uncharacterized protein